MRRERGSIQEDLALLQNENADPVERASALSRIAVNNDAATEELVSRFLYGSEVQLRAEAVLVLLSFWRKRDYLDIIISLLRSDPEWLVRANSAVAIALWAGSHPEEREGIVRELVGCLLTDSHWIVRKRCYEEILAILAPDRDSTTLPDYFEVERDVDWDLIRPYMTERRDDKTSAC